MTPSIARGASKVNGRGRHVIVVGSGFGGLAVAVRLLARGFRVTVLERRQVPGGRAYAFEEQGHVFDAGPSLITWPALFEELWALAGRALADDVRLVPVAPLYRVRFADGATIDFHHDAARMRAEVARFSPGDVAGVDALDATLAAIFCDVGPLMQTALGTPLDLLPFAPGLLQQEAYRSLHGLVSRHVRSERLRLALSFQPHFIGGSPFAPASAVYGAIRFLERRHGIHFPVGGTASLVRGLVGLIEGMGGTLRYGAEVDSLSLDGRRANGVLLHSGERIDADVVVSNADAAHTYRHLVPAAAREVWTDARLDRTTSSPSLFVWYFGTDRTWPEVAHHTLLLGPDYPRLTDELTAGRVPAGGPFAYLHRPTATDPSLAPAGRDTFYVLSPVPHLGHGERNVDWSVAAEPHRRAQAARLASTVLPGLERAVTVSRTITPQFFADALLSHEGAAFSFDPVLLQTACFRPHARSEDIDGLFLVGAGTHPGAGIPAVLCSARIVDGLIAGG